MQWDLIVENIKIFFNQPVPIIGCTIGFALMFILVIVSKTSIGKKSLNKIKKINADLKKQYDELIVKNEQSKKELDSKIANLKNEYEKLLQESIDKYNELETLLLNISSNIHHREINKLIKQHKAKTKDNEDVKVGE